MCIQKQVQGIIVVLAISTFFCLSSIVKAAESTRQLIGQVGFPANDNISNLQKLPGFSSQVRLQAAVDDCLDLKSVSIQDSQLVLVLAAKDKWHIQYELTYAPLLIRYFDKNGQYLGHFNTKERFLPEWGKEHSGKFLGEGWLDGLKFQQIPVIWLSEEGATLRYGVNARDADYIAIVEVSMDGFNDKLLPPNETGIISKKDYVEARSQWTKQKEERARQEEERARQEAELAKQNYERVKARVNTTARDIILDCGDGITLGLVQISAGTFTMGSQEPKIREPQHQVTISKAFYMGVFEVTQAQYQAVMGKHSSYFGGNLQSDVLPVEKVLWNKAVEFCQRLSEKTGRKVRLPTEVEWEYACRAGTTTTYNTGDTLNEDQANYRSGVYGVTLPVGSFQPNAWGLYDMHGNVSEWCSDRARSDEHVIRGGSWHDDSIHCSSAYSVGIYDNYSGNSIGFRVVLDNDLPEGSKDRSAQSEEINLNNADIETIKDLAEQGNVEAQIRLGGAYFSGKGIPQDQKLGMQWFEKAAKQDNVTAMAILGAVYYQLEDYTRAYEWSRKAADKGHSEGQFLVSVMYSKGQGVPQDNTEAEKWAAKSLTQTNAELNQQLEELEKKAEQGDKRAIEILKRLRSDPDTKRALEVLKGSR